MLSRAANVFDPAESSRYERAIVEVTTLGFSRELSGAVFRWRPEQVLERVVEGHRSQLLMFVRSKRHETESLSRQSVPKTWVDAFKLRWFPNWALKRFPAKQREIITTYRSVFHVCPHLAARPDQDHVGYLIRKEERV